MSEDDNDNIRLVQCTVTDGEGREAKFGTVCPPRVGETVAWPEGGDHVVQSVTWSGPGEAELVVSPGGGDA